ncbi:MAG: hypothetical protein GF364_04855 [Candidatus Lokiarchaeota archaeon]|nr:hypothetical protein [Candidatus Lokiarchaeota archaeon]
MVIFTLIGLIGGRWLWQRLSSSSIFVKGIPSYIKLIGIVAISIFFLILVIGFKFFFSENEIQIGNIVGTCTRLMFFITAYNAGYLLSIWQEKSKEKAKNTLEYKNLSEKLFEFKIKKKPVITFILFIIIWIAASSFIIYLIYNNLENSIYFYTISAGVGFAIGWVFWEHLKQTKELFGSFLESLKLVSIIFELVVIVILVIGMWIEYTGLKEFYKYALLGYLLLFYLMGAYFLGLLVETFKKNKKELEAVK